LGSTCRRGDAADDRSSAAEIVKGFG